MREIIQQDASVVAEINVFRRDAAEIATKVTKEEEQE